MKQTVKITGGEYSGRTIKTPGGETHPMGERERLVLFNMILPYLRNSSVLDLYCGGGTLGIEALSRGATRAIFVDNSGKAISVAKQNCQDLAIEEDRWETVISDTSRFMEYVDNQYDLVFADPPYDNYSPEMVRGISKIIAEGGIFVLSHPDKTPELIDLKLLKSHKYANAHISVYLKG